MGLIPDSSVVIAAERVGQTAYQMLEDIGLRSNGGRAGSSSSTICWPECRFIPVTVPIALRAGQIDRQTQAAVTRIALADLLIGVTALELDHAVATGNPRHFLLIPNLTVREF